MEKHSEFSRDENIISDFVPSNIDGFPQVTEVSAVTETPATVDVIGVKFKDSGKMYYFDPKGLDIPENSPLIVETTRGIEFGTASGGVKNVPASEVIPPLRPVVRIATEEDIAHRAALAEKEEKAYAICIEKIREHGLGMKLIEAEYTFDEGKLTFYFSVDGRVDFRELVKDLASVFRTRIELRQIGIRDEAKLLGGLGVCGRPFCCSTFLSEFVQVSIKMAKEQNMSLNSSKISGTCGRLMCCLKYEHEVYEEEIKLTPPVDSRVKTPDGTGYVKETNPLAGTVRVILDSEPDKLTEYHRDKVTVIGRREKGTPRPQIEPRRSRAERNRQNDKNDKQKNSEQPKNQEKEKDSGNS